MICAGSCFQRNDAVRKFRMGDTWMLIATDLVARGIDFKGVNCVINYDFPQTTTSYVHRIGRTGRAGRKGKAITYFTEDDMVRDTALQHHHTHKEKPCLRLICGSGSPSGYVCGLQRMVSGVLCRCICVPLQT